MSRRLVLMFHEVNDQGWFEKVLKYIARNYRFVSYLELHDSLINKRQNDRIAHVTFDDGHSSFFLKAFPILSKLGISSTLFVSPLVIDREQNYWFQRVRHFKSDEFRNFVADRSEVYFRKCVKDYMSIAILKSLPYRFMIEIIEEYERYRKDDGRAYMNITKNQLLKLSQSGLVEIGAHTLNHPILANESDDDSASEIRDSITYLSDLLLKPVRTFAYPNGDPAMDFGKRETIVLRENGIELAFSTESSSVYDDVDLMSIPRIGVSKGSPIYLAQKIRFARQWKYMKKTIFGKTETTERVKLAQLRFLQ